MELVAKSSSKRRINVAIEISRVYTEGMYNIHNSFTSSNKTINQTTSRTSARECKLGIYRGHTVYTQALWYNAYYANHRSRPSASVYYEYQLSIYIEYTGYILMTISSLLDRDINIVRVDDWIYSQYILSVYKVQGVLMSSSILVLDIMIYLVRY